MNKEKLYLLIIFFGLFLFIFNSVLIYLIFDMLYFILFLMIFISGSILVFFILYLRIQHNINRSFLNIKENVEEIKFYLEDKFNEQKEIYEEIVDLFDDLLIYLEDRKISSFKKSR